MSNTPRTDAEATELAAARLHETQLRQLRLELEAVRKERDHLRQWLEQLQTGLEALGMGDGPGAGTINGLLEMVENTKQQLADAQADKERLDLAERLETFSFGRVVGIPEAMPEQTHLLTVGLTRRKYPCDSFREGLDSAAQAELARLRPS